MWGGYRSHFSSSVLPPVLALFAVAQFYTFLPYTYTFHLKPDQGVSISAITSPPCPGAVSPRMVFSLAKILSHGRRCSSAVR